LKRAAIKRNPTLHRLHGHGKPMISLPRQAKETYQEKKHMQCGIACPAWKRTLKKKIKFLPTTRPDYPDDTPSKRAVTAGMVRWHLKVRVGLGIQAGPAGTRAKELKLQRKPALHALSQCQTAACGSRCTVRRRLRLCHRRTTGNLPVKGSLPRQS
jgi:hypothetical protein